MWRILLNWFRRQLRPFILSVVFVTVYELLRFNAFDDESQSQPEQDLPRRVTKSQKLRNFLLLDREEDLQLDTRVEPHHPKNKIRLTPASLPQPATVAASQPSLVDQEADIVVDTSGAVVNPHPFSYVIIHQLSRSLPRRRRVPPQLCSHGCRSLQTSSQGQEDVGVAVTVTLR